MLQNHDKESFEIFGYGLHTSIDETSKSLIEYLDHWHHCAHWDDDQLAAKIRADGIDILVDLGGYTAHCKITVLAQRVAPVQVIYLGYPCTTGMAEMDYIIGDHNLMPAGCESLYSEKPARLDSSFLCFQARPDTPDMAMSPAVNNGYVTFGSFNHLPKLSDRCVHLWSEVLCDVADSKLVLKALAFCDTGTKNRVWERFEKAGIEQHRIELVGPTAPIQKFLEEYRRIDIALDTVPYNGGTTTCDALWMGVPVVSLAGRHFYERMGASILSALGRPDWISQDESAYVKIASTLASDLTKLAEIRKNLRAEMQGSVLCDGAGFTRGLEQQFRQMLAALVPS